MRRLVTDADRCGVRTTVVADWGRSVLIAIDGQGAEFRRTGRKNWFVIAQRCEVDAPRTTFAEAHVEVVPCRTGGPGGQHRNKASTAVRATHRPTGNVVVVDTERQFSLNRGIAMRLLRERIEDANAAAVQALDNARWRIHDELVRGNPTRVERP